MNLLGYIWHRTRWFFRLPASFVYFCAMRVWAETTTGPYGNTEACSLTMDEAVARFSRIHALGGSGSDEHFDSNRKRAKEKP